MVDGLTEQTKLAPQLRTAGQASRSRGVGRQAISHTFMRHIIIVLCLLGLVACSTPNPNHLATAAAYEQVRCGMARAEVYALLGEPRSCDPAGDVAHCRQAKWSIPHKSRGSGHWTVTFAGDTVTGVKTSHAIVSVSP
jgi:hypothetical protein